MPQADFEGAKQYAIQRLERELSPALVYHSLVHTRDEVVPAVERLATMEAVKGEDYLLLVTAAYYHDIGFVRQREDHELVSVQVADEVLPQFDYVDEQIHIIAGIIIATRVPQRPLTLLEEIMADADLDSLGRKDYWTRSQDLRAEHASFGTHYTDEEWCRIQREFMQAHHYFTASARKLHDQQKKKNVENMLRRCQQYCITRLG